MIVRLIAETLTPIVTKSRFLKVCGAKGVVSNKPYLDLEEPTKHRCRTMLLVKKGANGYPIYRRAHTGYLHVDFKARTWKQASRKIQTFLQLRCVGQLTGWGYGAICWILQKSYHGQEPSHMFGPRFRILKGLPSDLTSYESLLIIAALLHDLVDTDTHPSKLGRPITIPDPYVRWLCAQHHAAKAHPHNPDLQLLQAADVRTSRYTRLLTLSTRRRKLAPVNTQQLTQQLEEAAQRSVYKLYAVIYHSQELAQFIASKTHPTESLCSHLIGVANWALFLVRTRASASLHASASLVGQPGGTPGPVEVEDHRVADEP